MKEIVTEKKSFKVRFISLFLAFMMLSMCIPVESFQNIKVMAANDDPIVLTNAKVEFRDGRFKSVDSAVSGESFYLMITIAANNVNFNNSGTYRVDIDDSNLLLTNFKGNGLVDGAKYSGFTLHVNSDGSRYITFDIQNGETKMIRLQAKFANGKTADGESCEITVSNSKGQSKSNSISAKSSVNWNSSKSQNMSSVDGDAIRNSGVSVNYTLSAAPASKAQTGAWWLTGLQFNDTVNLPDGMLFTDKAAENIKNSVASAIQNAGFSPDGDISVIINGGKADISFKINSSNTNAEMSRVSLNMPLNLNSETVSIADSFKGGNINNSLTVNGKPYGHNDYDYKIGENTVSLNVTVPTPPTPANFNLSKYVKDGKQYYMNDDEVEFVISATNNGGTAGDIVLTDVIPDGLQFVSMTSTDGTVNDKIVTFKNVAPNKTVTATVKCKVTADGENQLINTVNDGNGKSASASVNVRTKKTDIQISKSGYVDNGGQNYYTGIANQKAHYTITVSNNGTIDATDVKISDTIPDAITNPEIVETVDGVSISGNTLSGTVNIPAGDSVTINIEGTISADASGNIENTASANDKTSDKVTFTPKAPEPNLSINKSSSIANFIKSETPDVIYTITVKNDGNATAENVTVSDDIPADITVSEIKVGDTDVTSSLAKDNKFSTVISSILAGETVTVTIKGTISGTAKNNIENTAKYTYGNKTVSSNKVTIYAGDDPNKFKVTKRAINADDTDKEYVSYYDNEIEYEVTFTNNSNDTLTELYMYDIYRGYYDTSKNDIVI
ncbi:MAG TPA: hypothetical protein DIW26_00525, partial [Ruminococcus sp.]|nr:hypothetical protein [Ruminococcus sp.]